jgi:hypothetical protein
MKPLFNTPLTIQKLVLSVMIVISLKASSQPPAKADLSISSISIVDDIPKRGGGTLDARTNFANLKCTITVHNVTNNHVDHVWLAVVLPPEITIVSNSIPPTAFPAGTRGQWLGSLLYNLGGMDPAQDLVLEFVFTRSSQTNAISAIVLSGAPDPNPSNNSRTASY